MLRSGRYADILSPRAKAPPSPTSPPSPTRKVGALGEEAALIALFAAERALTPAQLADPHVADEFDKWAAKRTARVNTRNTTCRARTHKPSVPESARNRVRGSDGFKKLGFYKNRNLN